MLSINYNKALFVLLCLYAFLIPFEQILDVYFGVDTIFKPYRLVAIALIFTYALKATGGITIGKDFKEDVFLYGLFLYGILVSLVQMVLVPFGLGKFYNDLFQLSLYLFCFFIIKNISLSKREVIQIFWFLIAGILFNALYIFSNFYFFQNFRRQSGFMDNPNYVALAIVVAIPFILLRMQSLKRWLPYFFYLLLMMLLLFVFVISGSRTGLAIFAVAILYLFLFSSVRRKIFIILATTVFLLFSTNWKTQVELNSPLILIERLKDLNSLDDPRFPIWRGALRAAKSTFFLGMGIGQFKTRFSEFFQEENDLTIYRIVRLNYHLSAHSDYLAILTTYGAPGLFSYLFFLYFSFKKIVLKIWASSSKEEKVFFQFNFIMLTCLVLFGAAAENFNSAIYWFLLSFATKT